MDQWRRVADPHPEGVGGAEAEEEAGEAAEVTEDAVGLGGDRRVDVHEPGLVHRVKTRRHAQRDDNDDDGLYDDVRVRKHRRLDLEEAPAEDGIEVVPVDVLVCARNERCERRVREMNGASVVFSFSAMTYGDFPHISRRYSPFP